jgi:hypothetical protein
MRLGFGSSSSSPMVSSACATSWARWRLGSLGLSFHLRTLKDAGLVTDRREGRWIYYALNPGTVGELRDLVGTIGASSARRVGISARRCD